MKTCTETVEVSVSGARLRRLVLSSAAYRSIRGCSIARTYAWIESLVKAKLESSQDAGSELAHSKVIK